MLPALFFAATPSARNPLAGLAQDPLDLGFEGTELVVKANRSLECDVRDSHAHSHQRRVGSDVEARHPRVVGDMPSGQVTLTTDIKARYFQPMVKLLDALAAVHGVELADDLLRKIVAEITAHARKKQVGARHPDANLAVLML